MGGINWASIMAKANASLKTEKNQKIIERCCTEYIKQGSSPTKSGGLRKGTPITDAAEDFCKRLKSNMDSSLSSRASASIGEPRVNNSSVRKTGKFEYSIDVKLGGDLSRPSLYSANDFPDGYDGIDNIVDLLNYGVDHTMNTVYGFWESAGVHVASRTSIPATHFIERTASEFVSSSKNNKSVSYNGETIA